MTDTTDTTPATETKAPTARDRKAALLEQIRQVQAKREEAEEEREVLELELVLRFERELGARGKEFEIVATDDGPIVVKRGEYVLYKRFQASMSDGKDARPEDLFAYVFPCVVYPDKEAFKALNESRPYYTARCANALAVLHGAKTKDDRGKF